MPYIAEDVDILIPLIQSSTAAIDRHAADAGDLGIAVLVHDVPGHGPHIMVMIAATHATNAAVLTEEQAEQFALQLASARVQLADGVTARPN
ncbi:hypothetical protein ASE73_02655 [Sphingomonas sp. Leaf24]|uniref:hypothetical protein n=1 Tax=unclassified Sphingomonas TaxID=196159 RepID=UPI0006F8D3A7|nr:MULTISPECIES: hypothetical protein [unclassified Sphingomonas]KQM23144.1 hypothetical protein ASE50_02655 [Sphingomonas sp. Leaf5]KQM96002.1 hypothetical protein ASE73_02655 [Sphingomonas sp. Leaf24]